MSTKDAELASILFGKTRRAILALLYAQPEQSFYLRQMLGIVKTGNGALQREIKQLTASGLIVSNRQGNRRHYQANQASENYAHIQTLLKNEPAISQPQAKNANILIPEDKIKEFCVKHHILKLSFFGSVTRDDFRPESDIDVLVEFAPGQVPGFGIIALEDELSNILKRKVDLRTPNDLSKYFRSQVIREAKVQYEVA
ncbi:MAG: nucleotidyltransferase domain-containing protein [Dehalococcoidales bacterium]|nr:nucleotidyltransferase domain-containing protein [Dehalococcoidales bacterium]